MRDYWIKNASKLLKLISITIFAALFLISILTSFSFAQSPAKIAAIGNFSLENGQVIKDCKIAYRTFGKLNADSTNVILYPTWFGGTTAHLANVSAPGKIVDSTKYFVIALAALGNGESSSPSNSKLQPDEKFPEFNIRDMVHSQYKALKAVFGFKQVFAVIGGSMGSMQAYEWLLQYPDFMKKAVLYVATPKPASSDLLRFQIKLNMIEQQGTKEEDVWANLYAFTILTARTTGYLSQNTKPEELTALWQKWRKQTHDSYSLLDYAAQIRAMQQHNIFTPFNGNMKTTAAMIKADLLQIVSASDQILNPQPALDFAKYIKAETIVLEGNCGHLEPGCQMEKVSKAIDDFLSRGSILSIPRKG